MRPPAVRRLATRLEADFDEIFLVENNPDHMERGWIRLDLKGGRQ